MTLEEYNKANKIVAEIARLSQVLEALEEMEGLKLSIEGTFNIEGIGSSYSARILSDETAVAILKLAKELTASEKREKEAELVEI